MKSLTDNLQNICDASNEEGLMLPEHSSKLEEIEATITWMQLLAPHANSDKKRLLMNLHGEGQIADDMMQALFTLSNISEA